MSDGIAEKLRITLIKTSAALHNLEVAQKSSIASLFGININSLVAPTLALAYVPNMAVRKECLQLSRLHNLFHVFDSLEWTDHALPPINIGQILVTR